MAIFTTLAAVAGVGSGLMKGFGAQAAADARNSVRKSQAKIASNRADYEFELNNRRADAQWAWDMARTSQLRSVEAQNQIDSLTRGNQLISSAIENFQINSAALQDRFGFEESLRAKQAGLSFGYNMNKLAADAAIQVASYMKQVQVRGNQARNLVTQTERQSQELQQSLLLDQRRDYLNYNVQKLAAALADSKTKSTLYARQGSGKTSKRLAMEAGQKLGKLMVEMDIKRTDRRVKTALFNKYMNGEVSGQLGQYALQSEQDIQQATYTVNRYKANTQFEIDKMRELTIPSFALAARQGNREMQSLALQTKSTIQQAMQPYRQKEYFDPRKPISGLSPLNIQPNLEQGPSTGSILAGALLNGVSGAMSGYDAKTKTFT